MGAPVTSANINYAISRYLQIPASYSMDGLSLVNILNYSYLALRINKKTTKFTEPRVQV